MKMYVVYYFVMNGKEEVARFCDEESCFEWVRKHFDEYHGALGIEIEFDEDSYFEPNDYPEGDIGSALVAEMRSQNGE